MDLNKKKLQKLKFLFQSLPNNLKEEIEIL